MASASEIPTAQPVEAVTAAVALRLTRIYEAEIDRLVRLARVLTGNMTTGEDLAHEVFFRALRASRRDHDYLREPAWPWLRTSLVRLTIEHRRRLSREALKVQRWGNLPAPIPWPADTVDFVMALQTLPPRMRACVALFYGQDMSTADVAEALKCSSKTVEHQLRAARTRLASTHALHEPEV